MIDDTDTKVLAEAFVALTKRKGRYILTEPPIELTIMQTGTPGFLVVRDLEGKEVQRREYGDVGKVEELHMGDALRFKSLRIPFTQD